MRYSEPGHRVIVAIVAPVGRVAELGLLGRQLREASIIRDG